MRVAWLLLITACRLDFDRAPNDAVIPRGELWGEDDNADHRNVTVDTFVSGETFPDERDTNFGGELDLRAGHQHIALVRFDLSAIPPTSRVASAALRFDISGRYAGIDLYAVLESWSETSATWNRRTAGAMWTTPGVGAGSRDAQPLASLADGDGQHFLALPTALVETWIASPAMNFGLAIDASGTDNAVVEDESVHFVAREGASGMRPTLVLELK